jgi:hypothetical protein
LAAAMLIGGSLAFFIGPIIAVPFLSQGVRASLKNLSTLFGNNSFAPSVFLLPGPI